MLLLGDQVKEAIEEVESVVQSYKAALPFRLKASLLEHFSNEDVTKLCICFEDTLKKDPTCSHSLAKLINLHHDGNVMDCYLKSFTTSGWLSWCSVPDYKSADCVHWGNHPGYYSVEKLVEMIAWHLDATYADSHIWKEFASCFIRLAQCDDDRMSSCVDSYGDSCTERVKNVPDMFKDNVSRKNWRSRCRWWLTRHFTQTILASEVASGNVELLAYKAASACHLYGPESKYVLKACEYLKKEKSQERSNLKMHMANAIGFYAR
ncbi:Ran GTPase [Tanacetum coccineum]